MKEFKITISDEAITEIQDIIDYYDKIQIGLGKKFYTSVNQSLSSISKNPFYKIIYKNFRQYKILEFPYYIHFIVDELYDEVLIFSIYHTKRKPKY